MHPLLYQLVHVHVNNTFLCMHLRMVIYVHVYCMWEQLGSLSEPQDNECVCERWYDIKCFYGIFNIPSYWEAAGIYLLEVSYDLTSHNNRFKWKSVLSVFYIVQLECYVSVCLLVCLSLCLMILNIDITCLLFVISFLDSKNSHRLLYLSKWFISHNSVSCNVSV